MKKKFKHKKLVIVLAIVVVAVIVLAGIAKRKLASVAEAVNIVQLEKVDKRDLSDFISLTGTVSGETKINYSSTAGAEITSVNVQVGDVVKVGDVIATLDKDSIQKQINTLEKSLSNAAALKQNESSQNQHALERAKEDQKNQLAQANDSINSAEAAYTAAQNAVNSLTSQVNTVSAQVNAASDEDEKAELQAKLSNLQEQLSSAKSDLSAADTARKEAKSNYTSVKSSTDDAIYSAQSSIESAKYNQTDDSDTQTQLDQLKKQLEDCTITSKSEGIVTAVNISVGDVNTPNSTLVTVENNTDLIVNASVTEKDILKLQEGMKAIVTSDALDDQEINGEIIKVVKVYNASNPSSEQTGQETSGTSNTGGFSVQIKLDHCDLISGMSAKAKVVLTDRENVLSVPYDLVQQDEDGKDYVLCAEDNGDGTYTAVKKNITVGEEVNYYTEVTGGDLKVGDYVIMDYSISEGDTFTGEIGSDDSENADAGSASAGSSTSVSSEVVAD
ncbi:MAG: efflux RND transporter periplasmic adaptor subunit [Lachnospiraceae bacterium]|nr:efflux RND transporter periplasmic adaptor subunit [Lachnospiraceae bacterium]